MTQSSFDRWLTTQPCDRPSPHDEVDYCQSCERVTVVHDDGSCSRCGQTMWGPPF